MARLARPPHAVLIAVVVACALGAPSAHADSDRLAQARTALDEVKFDDAQRLLVGALEEGGNSPAAVREIYQLSASTAVVLGQRDVGEQYYRRWLALDPSASLSSDVAPKLREPFDAARSYVAAHGRLVTAAVRADTTLIEVRVTSDPLAMARSARLVVYGDTPVPAGTSLSVARTAQLITSGPEAARVEVLDEHGNVLALHDVPEAAPAHRPTAAPGIPTSPQRTTSKTWLAFGIPAAVGVGVALGFGTAAYVSAVELDESIEDSGKHFFTDVEAREGRIKTFTWIAGGGLAAGIVLGIPAAILYFRTPPDQRQVIPFLTDGGAGVSVSGRY